MVTVMEVVEEAVMAIAMVLELLLSMDTVMEMLLLQVKFEQRT